MTDPHCSHPRPGEQPLWPPPDADPGVIERLLESVPGQAGLDCTAQACDRRCGRGLARRARSHAGGVRGRPGGSACQLAVTAHRRGGRELLDPPGFVARSTARSPPPAGGRRGWRSRYSTSTGWRWAPASTRREMVTLVGAPARSSARTTWPGIWGADGSRCCCRGPGHSRRGRRTSAFARRCPPATAAVGVACGAAGFAELDDASASRIYWRSRSTGSRTPGAARLHRARSTRCARWPAESGAGDAAERPFRFNLT